MRRRLRTLTVFGMVTAAIVVIGMLVPVDGAIALPSAALDPIPGPVIEGTTIDVHGSNFDANTQLAVWLDTDGDNAYDTNEPIAPAVKDDVVPPYRVMTASDGTFSTKLSIDHVPAGHDAVVAAPCDKGDDLGWNVLCGGATGAASTPLDVALGLSEAHFGSGQNVTVSAIPMLALARPIASRSDRSPAA